MSRVYRFGDEEITVEDNLTPEEVRSVWMNVHPTLENAEIVENEDGTVSFETSVGTKG